MDHLNSQILRGVFFAALCNLSASALAADWSDTALSWRTGEHFREPFNAQNIKKNVLSLTHVSGYQYGSNFFNVDLLQSDRFDPGSLTQNEGAQEAYVVYRHTLDLGKLQRREYKFGAIRGLGLSMGFDWNAKNDVAYNSRKRMLVLGPTLMWDVPGYLNTSLLMLSESNAPSGAYPPISQVKGRYHYKLHPMLAVNWGIPVSPSVSFEGFANFIASKGKNEVGQQTGAETQIVTRLMFDLGALLGGAKQSFRAGLEYEYWNNKFGNTSLITGGKGYQARTPMLRAEYHF